MPPKIINVGVFVRLFQATEICPNCKSLGIENQLRYFYVNLDEALWKCSGATCLYPFDKFRFKNFANNTVYYYEKIADEATQPDAKVKKGDQQHGGTMSPLKSEVNGKQIKKSPVKKTEDLTKIETHTNSSSSIDDFDFDAFTAEFFKADSPEETQSSFKSDFDLMDGFGCQPEYKTHTSQPAEEQFDVNSLNDMLDDLINDKCGQMVDDKQLSVKCLKDDKRKLEEFDKSMAVHEQPALLPPRTIDLDKEERIGEKKYVEMPRPKLTKCFKHIAKKIHVKEEKLIDYDQSGELVPKVEVLAIKKERTPRSRKQSQTKDGKKMIMPVLRKSPAKVGNIDSTLISLIKQKGHFRPMAILERLDLMDISKASGQALERLSRSNMPKIETNIQREVRLNHNISQQHKGKIGKVKRIK